MLSVFALMGGNSKCHFPAAGIQGFEMGWIGVWELSSQWGPGVESLGN